MCVAAVAAITLALAVVGDGNADPADDALARLNELSTQALQSREAVTAAQRDLDARLADQSAAEERHRADQAALDAANSALQVHQAAVDRVLAMIYVSGRTGGLSAALTAESPQQLIDRAWAQRAVTAEVANQMKAFQSAREQAANAAQASATSAADARTAAERAAAVRADLQDKQRDLQRQIADAEAQYAALTPDQRAVIDSQVPPPPPPPTAPAPSDPAIVAMPAPPPIDLAASRGAVRADIPDALPVGVANEAGMQPNTIRVARAVSARFPQISEIGGVRPDPKPWHPNGLAIDVMIPNPDSPEGIELGNEILQFVLSNSDRFGLQDAIWRDTYYTPEGPQSTGYGHYDHVHVTTLPSR